MQKEWWNDAVVYQIYPRSFMDSNGDGIGDIRGILNKLDYIASLGVNTVWLCPVYRSPMVDNGYDISDYEAIHEEFGTMEELEELIAKAREKGITVLLDLVINHTSHQHEWFKTAVLHPDSKYRDYYYFKKSKDGNPPCNWRCNFGGPAWTKVSTLDLPGADSPENADVYYFHVFAPEQPDLNWETPAMRQDLYAMINRWLDKGIGGFRVDAINFIKKNTDFPDLPVDAGDGLAANTPCTLMYPGIEAFLAELRDNTFLPHNAYTVAEANGVTEDKLREYIGENGFFSAVFDFSYTDMDIEEGAWYRPRKITAKTLRDAVFASQENICKIGHGAVYLENHDQNRSPNKFLPPDWICRESILMLGTMYFFLQGAPYLYQGQEIGMTNYPWKSLEQFNDLGTNGQMALALDYGLSEEEAFALIAWRARDNARIPMLWDDTENNGFTAGVPWLPMHPHGNTINVKKQKAEPQSVLAYYQHMIALRRQHADLFYDGAFVPLYRETDNLIAYRRGKYGKHASVICNFSPNPAEISETGTIVLNNYGVVSPICGTYHMRSFEAMVILHE